MCAFMLGRAAMLFSALVYPAHYIQLDEGGELVAVCV